MEGHFLWWTSVITVFFFLFFHATWAWLFLLSRRLRRRVFGCCIWLLNAPLDAYACRYWSIHCLRGYWWKRVIDIWNGCVLIRVSLTSSMGTGSDQIKEEWGQGAGGRKEPSLAAAATGPTASETDSLGAESGTGRAELGSRGTGRSDAGPGPGGHRAKAGRGGAGQRTGPLPPPPFPPGEWGNLRGRGSFINRWMVDRTGD